MKLKILAALLFVAAIAPAAALADNASGQDRANAARACSALPASMGEATFAQTYGTAATNRENAFGRCVSQWTRNEHQNRHEAESACEAERNDANFAATHGGKSFDEFYGSGAKLRNAFGRCVAAKASAASADDRRATMNAARTCKAERKTLGAAAFNQRYGANNNDRNAFGKCVSKLAQQQND